MIKRIAIAVALSLVLLTGCASTKTAPPPRAPQWNSLPPLVLDSFCTNFRDEGISMSITINVMKTAQPSLITLSSMQALADSTFYRGPINPAAAAKTALEGTAELPITITPGCAWRAISPKTASHYIDTMTLEISPPFANPYDRKAAGLFARMSLADESPTWYWLPLLPRGDSWMAGRLTVLPYRQ